MTSDSILLNAKAASAYCKRSVATWWRLHASAKIPAPIKIGGATFWNRQELTTWIESGCPERQVWEASKGGKK